MAKKAKPSHTRKQEAQRLVNLRQAFGWTQRDLAKEFNVSHGAVAVWESGDRNIPGTVVKLMEIYEKKKRKTEA